MQRSRHFICIASLLVCLLLASCGGNEIYECLTPEMIPPGQADQFVGIAQVVQNLAAYREALLPRGPIEVCWEDETFYPDHEPWRSFVRNAIDNTWGAAFDWDVVPPSRRIRFVGWTRCSEGNNHGIRIRDTEREWNNRACTTAQSRNGCVNHELNPGWPRSRVGRTILGTQDGLYLRHTTPQDISSVLCLDVIGGTSEEARTEGANRCDYWTAVHEFGHALGLSHESSRIDSNCGRDTVGQGPDTLLGPIDILSVMGCGPPDINAQMGPLIRSDFEWIRALYYPEYSSARCAIYGRHASAFIRRHGGTPQTGELTGAIASILQSWPGVNSDSAGPRNIPAEIRGSHETSVPQQPAASANDSG